MKPLVIILPALLLLMAPNASSENIYSLIKQGKLDQAADSLSGVTTASTRDGNKLFFASLLEPEAKKSARLMEAALKTSVASVYRQEIYFRLAQYHLLEGDYQQLGQLVSEYRAFWEAGKYRQEMQRLSALLDEKEKAFDAAVRQTDRYLLENTSGHAKQWGTVDKARVMTQYGKQVGAHNLLKKLAREKSGPGVSQALYLLTLAAIEKKATDDAVFYYNLLREGYPNAVGLSTLVNRMGELSSTDDTDNRAEKATGTFYSVQVGVFSIKGNAKKQAKMFEQYDREVDIKGKKISNVQYHVVYVGRFTNYDAARKFKTMLEGNHKEVYQVVAR
jgi:tetratricopeptide (TPR) repeat protein